MTAPIDAGSYSDYLESVRRQEDRDRDRFTGADSHEDEPLYSAETGQPAADGLDELLEKVWVGPPQPPFTFSTAELWDAYYALVPTQCLAAFEVAERKGIRPKREKKARKVRTRHTYPRSRREWWNR